MHDAAIMETGEQRRLSPTLVLTYLWIAHFALDALMGFWTIHKTVAGLDIVKAGAIASVALLLGNGMQIIFGYLGDRGWRNVLLPLSMVLAANMCFLSITDNYVVLGAMVLLAFLGSAAFHPIGAGVAAQLMPQRRALMTSVFLTGGYAGYGVSQLMYAELYSHGPSAVASFVLLPFIGGILLMLLPKVKKRSPPRLGEMWRESVGKRMTLVTLYVLIVCVAMANLGMLFLLPEIMMAYGASEWMIYGGAHMIWILSGGLGLLPFGFLSDRIGPRQTMLFANVGSCLVMTLLLTAFGSSDVHLACLFMLFGLCSGACHPIAIAYGNALMPTHGGTISGVFMGGAWALGGLGPLLLSWIAADMQIVSMQQALLVVVCFWVLTVVFALLLPRARTHTQGGYSENS